MGLLDVIRSGVKTADSLTRSLQSTVTYERCTAKNQYGKKTFATAVPLKALFEKKNRMVQSPTGVLVMSTGTLSFLDVAALSTATGGAGLSVEDQFTLSDGVIPSVINVGGFVDAGTNQPFASDVYLG